MTREEIEQVVKRTIEWLNGYAWADDNGNIHLPTMIRDFTKESREYFDKLVSQPSLPSDLDEAAEIYADGENPTCPCEECLVKTFKAGAEWRDAQTQKLPDNVDEAAEEIIREKYPSFVNCVTLVKREIIELIKAGYALAAGREVRWHDVSETPSIFGVFLVIHDKGWCVANYLGKGTVCESGWVEIIHNIAIEHPQKWMDLRDLIPATK